MSTDKVLGYDYEGEIVGTSCIKCHKLSVKQDPTWLENSTAEPILKSKLHKDMYIDCGDCGKIIWGSSKIKIDAI